MGYAPGEREKIEAMIAASKEQQRLADEKEKRDREWAEQTAAYQAKQRDLERAPLIMVPVAVIFFALVLGNSVRAYQNHDVAYWLLQGAGLAAGAAFWAQGEIRHWLALMGGSFVLAVASVIALG